MSKTNTTPLKATQFLLWKLITAPEGVVKALHTKKRKSLPIKGDARLSGVERLDIYANMYFFRIRDALKEDFPQVLRTIGEDEFHNLVTDYLVQFPPTHFSLRYVGQHLSHFLRKYRLTKKITYLSDLAKFEWALLTAFDAEDVVPLTKVDLQNVAPESWAELCFTFSPSVSVASFDTNIKTIYEKILRKKTLAKADIQNDKTFILFWRQNLKSYYRPISSIEKKIMDAAQSGKSFAELCALCVKHRRGDRPVAPTQSAMQMAAYLQGWFNSELLSRDHATVTSLQR